MAIMLVIVVILLLAVGLTIGAIASRSGTTSEFVARGGGSAPAAFTSGGFTPSGDQVPDTLAAEGARKLADGDAIGALHTYGDAIDKVHTMCVVARPESRIRWPGPVDQPILDGFTSAPAAAASSAPNLSATVDRSTEYLRQIALEAGPEAGRYLSVIEQIQAIYLPRG